MDVLLHALGLGHGKVLLSQCASTGRQAGSCCSVLLLLLRVNQIGESSTGDGSVWA